MTNYDYIVKNNPELVKSILVRNIGKMKGIAGDCMKIRCYECDFNCIHCQVDVEKWLEEKYISPYKKGDIVIDSNNQLAVVKKEDDCDEGVIEISHFADNTRGIEVNVTDIKKKVGNIYDDK